MWKYDQLSDVQQKLLDRNIIDLQGEVDEAMGRYVREALVRLLAKGSPPILILITSGGGDAVVSLDIYDGLMMYEGKKVALVMDRANSSAAFVMQACDIRLATRHAGILIHHISRRQVSLDVLQNTRKLKKLREDVESRQAAIDRIFARRTGKTLREIRAQCRKDQSFKAQEALRFGLIDHVVDSREDAEKFLK